METVAVLDGVDLDSAVKVGADLERCGGWWRWWSRGHSGKELQGAQKFGRNGLAAVRVACVNLVFVPAGVKRAAPSGVAENDAVMLKSAKGKVSLGASCGVNVSVPVTASLERLSDPVLKSELCGDSRVGHNRSCG